MITFNKKDVLTALNREDAEIYIGEKGYYCYRMHDWRSCELLKVHFDEDYDVRNVFTILDHKTELECPMFLPTDKVKEEKQYRPFTADEFLKLFKVGDVIEIKHPNAGEVITLITSIRKKTNELTLGCLTELCSFKECFESGTEIFLNNQWQPFGVEE